MYGTILGIGYYVINLEDTNENLSEEEINTLCSLIQFPNEESYYVEFTEIIYDNAWLNDCSAYVVFKTNVPLNLFSARVGKFVRAKNSDEYIVYTHGSMNARDCKTYKIISSIGANHYKWWKKYEENLDDLIEYRQRE